MESAFITTYTGLEFDYDDFKPDDIDIRDIAHSLSHLCRFCGHTNIFYSVAQHCLLVSEKIPGGPEVKLAALLHDASEAYVGDLPGPLKKWLVLSYVMDVSCSGDDESVDIDPVAESYVWLHDKILDAVYDKYGVVRPVTDVVRIYDAAAQQFEMQAFMAGTPVDSDGMLWDPWDPKGFAASITEGEFMQAEVDFLKRFEDLMAACGWEHLV